jgi:hypothetical protein
VNAADQAEVLTQMVESPKVRTRDLGVIATWLAENTEVPDVLDAAEELLKAQWDAGLCTMFFADVKRWWMSQ